MGLRKFFKSVTKIFKPIIKIVSKAISWLIPKPPELPDFGTSEFDDFEKGILVN